ncbi:hypothetical protein BKA70DRAFT_1437548 [Coprinopsis sp. MPI-PUGE-AT-0042]|nr:hypothetical protein BKA70DRAFT_1437548 [Coprinopsis sp. MPI-PUGE-AT-0042]
METPSQGNSSTARNPVLAQTPNTLTSGGTPSSSARTPRAKPKTTDEKVDEILNLMKTLNITLAAFLFYLFRIYVHDGIKEVMDDPAAIPDTPLPFDSPTRVKRAPIRQGVITALLNGTSKPPLGTIMKEIWKNALETSFKTSDTTAPDRTLFTLDHPLGQIQHAQVALTTFAVLLSAKNAGREAEKMVNRCNGLHLRAQVKVGGRGSNESELITWKKVDDFNFGFMEEKVLQHAPVMWHLTCSYVGMEPSSPETNAVWRNRPKNLVTTNAIMVLTFGRSNRANYLAMCRGIWHFATRASKTLSRVESRLGLAVASSTVRQALRSMSAQQQRDFGRYLAPRSGLHAWLVADNIQAWAKKRDHRIGTPSQLVSGMSATMIPMARLDPEAFNLKQLLDAQADGERDELTLDTILADIDWTHIKNVTTSQFLQTLIGFRFNAARITKLERPKDFRSEVFPLATSSANEMKVQELKRAVEDFAGQIGIEERTVENQFWPFSGDRKTFDVLHRLRRFLSPEKGNFSSLRWMVPMLEIWHTKWTYLSWVIRASWGVRSDPSSLACLASIAECPTPSNLRKVEFHDGQQMVNDGHVLNCWEQNFNTTDLVAYFEALDGASLPSFDTLITDAERLGVSHASTQAFDAACEPLPSLENITVPIGTPWTPARTDAEGTESGEESEEPQGDDTDTHPDLLLPELEELPLPTFEQAIKDTSLANNALFKRDAIWWREVCLAVAVGDTGRILEMFKIWIFTFAGSGNPLYSTFLIEVYCNFKWEFSEATQKAFLMYWLVNLSGLPGHFIELDLLQEHFNFWLEDIVQHKGKDFDDPFYREVVAMNIQHFLKLKDEMEGSVLLKA